MRRGMVVAGTALLVLAAAALAFHDALAGAAIRAVAGGMGYDVRFRQLQVGFTAATAMDTNVTNRAGEPVFSADRIDVRYSLRNVLPGSSRRRFGISALDIARPTVTLIHHADGSYNVTLPATATSSRPDTSPIDLRLRVRDGSVVLLDRYIVPGRERRQRIVGLAADAVLAPHAHSFYNVRFDLDDGRALHPVYGKATFASDRGYEAQRWTAADVPIGPLVDFVLPSHAVDIVDGNLHNVDGRIYTFVDPDGTTHAHSTLRADLERGKIYIAGVVKPLRDARGTVFAYDNGLTTGGLDATLAGVPLHLAGGMYDFSAPKLYFALVAGGELEQLQQAIAASQRQPLTGPVSFAVLALGSLNAPVLSGTFSSPQLVYRGLPIERPSGRFSIHGSDLDLLSVRLAYGPVEVEAHGTLALEKDVRTNLVVALRAAGDRLPYVAQLLHDAQLNAVVHVAGTGRQLGSAGIVYGTGRDGTIDGIFDVDGNGDGTAGPLSIERSDGASLYARVALRRTAGSVLAIADAHRFSLLPAKPPPLPGLAGSSLPALAGTLDAQLAGSLDGGRLDGLSGHVRLAGLRYGTITAGASADLGTAADGTQRGSVHVASSLGRLDGDAAYAGGLVGFAGRLHASFAQLRPLTGSLAAQGDIDGSLRALSDGATSAVQTDDLRFVRASVAGVPLGDASATATLHGGRLDVRALQLGVAGGTVTVRGALGNGGELVATTSALDLRALGGRLRANARVHGTLDAPSANVALLVDGAGWNGIGVSANAFGHYERGDVHVADATAIARDSYATASGDVRGLAGPGSLELDVTANLYGAQIAPIARALRWPLRYPDGEVDAVVRATGTASAPRIAGSVRIPRGSLNGLDFRDAAVTISGTPNGVAARNGTVTVGTTAIAFSGDAGPAAQSFDLRAPHADLADFDDYFDAADTLAGTGHVVAHAAHSGAGTSTNGDVLVNDARYRRFSVGTVAATWQTAGRGVHAAGSVRSDHGAIELAGDVTLPAADPLRDFRHRAALDATATLAGLDLGKWLPAAGITLPVLGVASGSMHVSGTLAAPAFAATAAVNDALIYRYPLSTLTLAASGDGRGAHLSELHFAGPGLTADASGTFGYGAGDPVAIALHVQSADVGVLAKSLGAKWDIAGALSTTLDASGSRNAPQLAQTIDASDLRTGKYTLPKLHVQLAADPQTVQLQAFEADLVRGRVLANATLPIQLTAPAGLRDAPLKAGLHAEGIDLAQFAVLLPEGTNLAGTLNGAIEAGGTESDPAVTGALTLAGGSYSSNLLRSALTNVRARFDFTHAGAKLSDVHADVGGGAIDGAATATLGDLRDPRRTLAFSGAFTAKNASLNIANLFRGTVDGTLEAAKPQGEIPVIGGTLTVSKARLPLAALILRAPPNAAEPVPPAVAFNLNVQVGNDVRVQGPGVDVGARGAIALGGNLAHPELDGRIASTDGTLSFYRTFVLRSGTVVFRPGDGLIPEVDATATTTISNPATNILLHVTGPATNLNLDLASSPSYDKAQILGLLVNPQALGAVRGVGINAGNIAGSVLSQQFTQNLLQPLGSNLGQALGFENLALGYSFNNGFSAGARKQFGKNLSTSFHQTFGGDERQSLAIAYSLPNSGALALTLFNAGNQPPSLISTQRVFAPIDPTNYTLQSLQPPPGVGGVVLTYQRKFR